MTDTRVRPEVTTDTVHLVEGRFVCSTCVPAETRDALSAVTESAERKHFVGTRNPVTACCGSRLTFRIDEIRVLAPVCTCTDLVACDSCLTR